MIAKLSVGCRFPRSSRPGPGGEGGGDGGGWGGGGDLNCDWFTVRLPHLNSFLGPNLGRTATFSPLACYSISM